RVVWATRPCHTAWRSVDDLEQLNFKNERLIRSDGRTCPFFAVRQLRRNRDMPFVAHFHQLERLRPTGNDVLHRKLSRPVSFDTAVEHFAAGKSAVIVNTDGVVLIWRWS